MLLNWIAELLPTRLWVWTSMRWLKSPAPRRRAPVTQRRDGISIRRASKVPARIATSSRPRSRARRADLVADRRQRLRRRCSKNTTQLELGDRLEPTDRMAVGAGALFQRALTGAVWAATWGSLRQIRGDLRPFEELQSPGRGGSTT